MGEVVGQKQITDVLARSIKEDKVAHAYLFIGPRGTGKTSVARILAHEVNGFKYELEDDYVDIIKSLNPDRNLDLLYVGDLYYLPTTEDNLKTKVYTTVMSHIMLEDETVESVYSRYGIDFASRREELQRYNPVAFDRFRPGSKLYIPLIWN